MEHPVERRRFLCAAGAGLLGAVLWETQAAAAPPGVRRPLLFHSPRSKSSRSKSIPARPA
ncbi:hypothetical protein ACTWPB_22840 [Nocardia sp. IBHARD005]|uniref:hypothetical protein n=1 Tax=Nocardia sp. IBHARD005 TaxID=3457765 RepID=UPI00405A2397